MKPNRSWVMSLAVAAVLVAAMMLAPHAPQVHASTQPQGDMAGYQQDLGVIAPSHAAATATEEVTVYIAQRACRLKRVDFAPRADITGAATNYTDIQITKNGTVQGSAISYQSGTNATANTKINLYAPTTPLALAAGDRVTLKYTKTGTGLLIPDLYVQVVTDFEP